MTFGPSGDGGFSRTRSSITSGVTLQLLQISLVGLLYHKNNRQNFSIVYGTTINTDPCHKGNIGLLPRDSLHLSRYKC